VKLKLAIIGAPLLCVAICAPAVQVTFQVDMSVQMANGAFKPSNGDSVEARLYRAEAVRPLSP
jgi:hypothetical protein